MRWAVAVPRKNEINERACTLSFTKARRPWSSSSLFLSVTKNKWRMQMSPSEMVSSGVTRTSDNCARRTEKELRASAEKSGTAFWATPCV
jgi:hypothetical protein